MAKRTNQPRGFRAVPRDETGRLIFDPHVIDRFWEKVDRLGAEDVCWEWRANRSKFNYGRFRLYDEQVPAHRVSYALEFGDVPAGLVLHHRCGNRGCVNPAHLEPLSVGENSRIGCLARGPGQGSLQRGETLEGTRRAARYRSQGVRVKSPLERFWRHVDKGSSADSCWVWTGAKNRLGYGAFVADTKTRRHMEPHRFAYMALVGPIPAGMEVCHDCPGGDNPSCVRPDHMFAGTHRENLKDSYLKGHWSPKKGSENWLARLSETMIVPMVEAYMNSHRTLTEVGRDFGVSGGAVQSVVCGRTWKHVPRHIPTREELRQREMAGCVARGHVWDETNTFVRRSGLRACRTCASMRISKGRSSNST